jgi:hypothetical protein
VAEAPNASGACPEVFEREMGCTAAELRSWQSGLAGHRALELSDGTASLSVDEGWLRLAWTVLPPRRIALLVLPRLKLSFRFEGVTPPARAAFLRHFDLYTQRGGG